MGGRVRALLMPAPERYRGFTIEFRPPPIPSREHDWAFVHDDYDGPGDRRADTAPTLEDAKAAIDELIEDLEEQGRGDEVRGARCGADCGHCGACS